MPEENLLNGWPELEEELKKPYMQELSAFLKAERAQKRTWYPDAVNIFRAFKEVPREKVRCVILGQDPYHGPQQAQGLSFSVPNDLNPKPPSLLNIFKEIEHDLGGRPPQSDLTPWTHNGVLLLNSVLTVGAGMAASHRKHGWEQFTDKACDLLNEKQEGIVFLLWGKYAQEKGSRIDRTRHFVLTAAHPSPLSASTGFFGCRHFSQTNVYLQNHKQKPIDWLMEEALDA